MFHDAVVGNISYISDDVGVFEDFLVNQRSASHGRARYMGDEFVRRSTILHSQGEGLDVGKHDGFSLGDVLQRCVYDDHVDCS